MKFTRNLLLSLTAAALLGACGKSDSGSGGGGGKKPPKGTITQDGMSITIDNDDDYQYHLSQSTSFASNCIIPLNQSSQDMTCYLDAGEEDLYFHGVKLNYNIPEGMCPYVHMTNYYYLNSEVGVGPTSIYMYKELDVNGNIIPANSICRTSETKADGTGRVDGPDPILGCLTNPEVDFSPDAMTWGCVYDQTGNGLPNCCFGKYTWTKEINDNGITTITSGSDEWGGSYTSCFGGPYTPGWPRNSQGYPLVLVEYSKKGKNANLEIPSPIKTANYTESLMTSNFYKPSIQTHDGFYVARTSTVPYAIDPVDDRNGSNLADYFLYGHDSFQFLCVDEAGEVLNRIRIYTREWNTYEQLLTYISTSGVSGDPDVAGSEPCTNVGFLGQCNDSEDWDDIGTRNLNYPTNPATDLDDRVNYFPNYIGN